MSKLQNTTPNTTVVNRSASWVKCRKTGKWYNPEEQFRKRMSESSVQAVFKRLADR